MGNERDPTSSTGFSASCVTLRPSSVGVAQNAHVTGDSLGSSDDESEHEARLLLSKLPMSMDMIIHVKES